MFIPYNCMVTPYKIKLPFFLISPGPLPQGERELPKNKPITKNENNLLSQRPQGPQGKSPFKYHP